VGGKTVDPVEVDVDFDVVLDVNGDVDLVAPTQSRSWPTAPSSTPVAPVQVAVAVKVYVKVNGKATTDRAGSPQKPCAWRVCAEAAVSFPAGDDGGGRANPLPDGSGPLGGWGEVRARNGERLGLHVAIAVRGGQGEEVGNENGVHRKCRCPGRPARRTCTTGSSRRRRTVAGGILGDESRAERADSGTGVAVRTRPNPDYRSGRAVRHRSAAPGD
jgi:hypothetical protein